MPASASDNAHSAMRLVGVLSLLTCLSFIIGNLITAALMWWWETIGQLWYLPRELIRAFLGSLLGLILLHTFVGGERNGENYTYGALGGAVVLTFIWLLAGISIVWLVGLEAGLTNLAIFSGIQVAIWWGGVWFGYVRYFDAQ